MEQQTQTTDFQTNTCQQEQGRSLSLDVTKAFAIFCVVLGHVIQWTFPGDAYTDNVLFAFIYAFHMPLFAMVSGYCVAHSLNLQPWQFVSRRAMQLLLPVVSFAVMYWIWRVFFIGSSTFCWREVFSYLCGGDLWFLKYLFVDLCIIYFSKRLLPAGLLVFLPPLLLFCFTRSGIFRLLPYLWVGYLLYSYKNWVVTHLRLLFALSLLTFVFFLFGWRGEYDAPLRFLYFKPTLHFDPHNSWAVFIRLGVGISGSLFFIMLFRCLEAHLRCRPGYLIARLGSRTLGIYALQLYLLEHGLTNHIPLTFVEPWAIPLQLLIAVAITIICDLIVCLFKKNRYTALFFLGILKPRTDRDNAANENSLKQGC